MIKFSKICPHPLKSGKYMLLCDATPIPPYIGTLSACKKAQKTFEAKLQEEFSKLPNNRKKEVLKELHLTFIPAKRTALDGKTWWCVWDVLNKRFSDLLCFGKYRTKTDCQIAIDLYY